ncbi:predicted protein [Sclerotinia sclerotiorum 1980 UF-70]|uniref:Uncharacterized protein n=1 Tax=Sclerotinia sclerotiorum (strain ATCC 18683 / 1980 / Ss-1) TaxID=665079 RepID=A7ELR5_SCLS1|nr:predicted protein [Sclerotinia sclerotiorum 1980 UF-70]EDO03781.1 predicted protein [Sclerotinia sclerotiorum 1980 UF-70]
MTTSVMAKNLDTENRLTPSNASYQDFSNNLPDKNQKECPKSAEKMAQAQILKTAQHKFPSE